MYEADLDGSMPLDLEVSSYGFTEADMDKEFDLGIRVGSGFTAKEVGPKKLRDILARLKEVYAAKVKRSTRHTHTHRQRTTPPTPVHTHTRHEQHPKPPNEHLPQTLNRARCASCVGWRRVHAHLGLRPGQLDPRKARDAAQGGLQRSRAKGATMSRP